MLSLKLLGAALIITAGGLFSGGIISWEKNHCALLSDISTALEALAEKLEAYSMALPAAFSQMAEKSSDELRNFFNALNEKIFGLEMEKLWGQEVEKLPLLPDEKRSLAALGACLGKSDAETQSLEIRRVRAKMLAYLDERRKGLGSFCRCCMGVGISASAIIAVMLL